MQALPAHEAARLARIQVGSWVLFFGMRAVSWLAWRSACWEQLALPFCPAAGVGLVGQLGSTLSAGRTWHPMQAVAGEVPSVMGVKLAPPGMSPGRYMVRICCRSFRSAAHGCLAAWTSCPWCMIAHLACMSTRQCPPLHRRCGAPCWAWQEPLLWLRSWVRQPGRRQPCKCRPRGREASHMGADNVMHDH